MDEKSSYFIKGKFYSWTEGNLIYTRAMIYLAYLLMCRLLAIIYLYFFTKFLRYLLNNYVFIV